MNRTLIEWCQNPDGTRPGWSWSPVTGCLKGCTYCYARKLANGRLKARYESNGLVAYDYAGDGAMGGTDAGLKAAMADPFYPRYWPGKLEEVSPLDKPRGIFVCNMGELFGPWLPKTWTEHVMETISEAPQHRFYLLTKQTQELVKWSPFPPNCWVGVTVTDAQQMSDAYVGLGRVKAAVKYLSYEPLLSNLTMEPQFLQDAGIDLVIIGAQTKPSIMPQIEWVREIVEAADEAGVPVFLKDSLLPLVKTQVLENLWWADHRDGRGLETPHLDLRQEMPGRE